MTTTLPIHLPSITHPIHQLKPYHDRLTIVPDAMDKFSRLGLHIPDTVKDKPYSGTIIQVGKRCQQAKEGMRVIFGKHSGTEVTINSDKFLIMREVDLIINLDDGMPFADRVVIIPEYTGRELASGLIIPDNVEEQPQTGHVKAVGDQCVEVVKGAHVIFGKFAGMSITLKGASLLVMRELDVVGSLT